MTTEIKTSTDKKTETALARFDDVRNLMAEYDPSRFIRLVPTVFQERSDLYRPAVLIVTVDPDDKRDVYDSPAGDKTVCLRARKLEGIGGAIGVRWIDVKMERTETTVRATVYAEVTDAVGDRIPLVAGATEYLTATKGRSVSTYPEEKAQARARAIIVKKLTGLPTSFSPDELRAKNFIGLRWILDDRQPDIREAVINRGLAAANEIYGKRAPEKAIDAGHEGPEDSGVIEGRFADTTVKAPAPVEPEIPDEETAAPALDVPALRARLEGVRAKLRGADGPANPELVLSIGVTLRDVLALGERVEKSRWPAVRLAVLAALWGVGSTKELTAHQASATLTWLADDGGKAQARALFDGLIAADAVGAAQPTLLDAAAKL